MAQKYAKGSKAWGICGRSGRKMLLSEMVTDGRYPNMRVDPAWYEGRHPQEYLPKVDDPVALFRPSPEVIIGPTAPVLAVTAVGVSLSLTWTPAESDITEIASYVIFRGADGADPTQFLVCAVLRDFLGGIIGIDHCITTPSIRPDDTGTVVDKVTVEDAPVTYVDNAVVLGHTYCYYVMALPMGNNLYRGSGPPSAASNTDCVLLALPQATSPVLSGAQVGVTAAILLNWTASTISVGTITNYQIFRNLNGGGFSLLTTVGNVLTFTDNTITIGGNYGYYVVAVPNIGTNSAPSNTVQVPTVNDPFFNDVGLLLHFDGAGASTTFVDSSQYHHVVTAAGTAALETGIVKFGTAAGLFDGSNARIYTPIVGGGSIDIGLGDFTLDGWINPGTQPGGQGAVFFIVNDVNDNPLVFYFNSSNNLLVATLFANNVTSGINSVPEGVWSHFALVVQGAVSQWYINGIASGPPSSLISRYALTANYNLILGDVSVSSSGIPYNGYLDEFRLTKVARYTANFTPPTGPSVP